MKLCKKCNTQKSILDFNKDKGKKDGLQSCCRSCSKLNNKQTYQNNKKRRTSIQKRNKKIRLYNSKLVTRLKRKLKCKFCKEAEPCALDLHHVNPKEKDLCPSKMITYSTARLKKEIKKCIVVCSNCHRKIHAGILKV